MMTNCRAINITKKALAYALEHGGWRGEFEHQGRVCVLGAVRKVVPKTANRADWSQWASKRLGVALIRANDILAPRNTNPAAWTLRKILAGKKITAT